MGREYSLSMAAHPEKIGRYEILEVAGQGAMGVVYKAKDPFIGRTVAIKVMSAAVSLRPDEQEEYRQRFFREAQAAGRLRHDNIVSIYDVGYEGGAPYMVQEYLEGQSLSSRLKETGPLPLGESVSILRQVADGLAYAHEQGIVHRDIKPDNILVDAKGKAVITDFGVARFSTSDLTRTGEVLGTPHFMSPEQVIGEPVDGRSDLFSLGVIFYLMLSGQRPFQGDTTA
jgi:eukaryotic-like serine/threonine-protein kinase